MTMLVLMVLVVGDAGVGDNGVGGGVGDSRVRCCGVFGGGAGGAVLLRK